MSYSQTHSNISKSKSETPVCYHCGLDCDTDTIRLDDHYFCCDGCKLVYSILSENNLCTYYNLTQSPGSSLKNRVAYKGRFSVLDNEDIRKRFVRFTDGDITRVTFYIPAMHCSSCIWLLEHLHKLDEGIVSSVVNFPKRTADIIFKEKEINLSGVAELLASVGYEPHVSLNELEQSGKQSVNRSRILKIGVAGFCFGNIMMLSFPEYFSLGNFYDQPGLKPLFSLLNLSLSLPVLLYSGREFFVSAIKSIRNKHLNIDAPIALAIFITFVRSVYEVSTGTGSGYFDSMTGIVFFMLIGRYFQNKTYDNLSFDRDYKSFFPIGVSVLKGREEIQVPIAELKPNDRMLIRNHELVPADALLLSNETLIDYSFVTGESAPVRKKTGDIIYAGGKLIGVATEFSVVKPVSQSYLTQLWNSAGTIHKKNKQSVSYTEWLNTYFSWALLAVAVLTAGYWAYADSSKLLGAVTSILIVACPCALLLSSTFAQGNILSILGRNHFYLKQASVIDTLASADTIVFDKTGTITQTDTTSIEYVGTRLTGVEKQMVHDLVSQSSHPLSRLIASYYDFDKVFEVLQYSEVSGKGLYGEILGEEIEVGSAEYLGISKPGDHYTSVYVSVNGRVKGRFNIHNAVRAGLSELVQQLSPQYDLFLLSGDNNADRNIMAPYFNEKAMLFNQKPDEKYSFIDKLMRQGHKPIMIGDGLNDAGALQASYAGIAVSDNVNNFSPACDAIIQGDALHRLPDFIGLCKNSKTIIFISFVISVIYNIIGLFFAVRGELQPVVAAVLMPVSSVSIVLFTTLGSRLLAKWKYRLH